MNPLKNTRIKKREPMALGALIKALNKERGRVYVTTDSGQIPGDLAVYPGNYTDLAITPGSSAIRTDSLIIKLGTAMRTAMVDAGTAVVMDHRTPVWFSDKDTPSKKAIMDVQAMHGRVILILQTMD